MATAFPDIDPDDVWGEQLVTAVTERLGGAFWQYRTSSSQSFPNAWTAIGWGTEDADPDNCHDNSTNPSRWTAQADGIYLFAVGMCYDGSGGVYFQYAINGTRVPGRLSAPAGGNCSTTLTRTFALTAGDYVEFMGYTSGGDGATKVLADDESIFTVTRIGS